MFSTHLMHRIIWLYQNYNAGIHLCPERSSSLFMFLILQDGRSTRSRPANWPTFSRFISTSFSSSPFLVISRPFSSFQYSRISLNNLVKIMSSVKPIKIQTNHYIQKAHNFQVEFPMTRRQTVLKNNLKT